MRYKIKTPNEQTYRDIQETLRAGNIPIYVACDGGEPYLSVTLRRNSSIDL
jgi:hypothetical protein